MKNCCHLGIIFCIYSFTFKHHYYLVPQICVFVLLILDTCVIIVSPVRMYVRGYYGLVIVTQRPPPHPQTFHRSHDNLKNPYQIASIFYM